MTLAPHPVAYIATTLNKKVPEEIEYSFEERRVRLLSATHPRNPTAATQPQQRRIQARRRRSSPVTRSYHLALEGGVAPSLGLGAPGFTFINKLLKDSTYLTSKNPSNQALS
ncbi:hypothetical protein AgCh_004275 [Apium graveolens]